MFCHLKTKTCKIITYFKIKVSLQYVLKQLLFVSTDKSAGRRGLCGTMFVFKIAGYFHPFNHDYHIVCHHLFHQDIFNLQLQDSSPVHPLSLNFVVVVESTCFPGAMAEQGRTLEEILSTAKEVR